MEEQRDLICVLTRCLDSCVDRGQKRAENMAGNPVIRLWKSRADGVMAGLGARGKMNGFRNIWEGEQRNNV